MCMVLLLRENQYLCQDIEHLVLDFNESGRPLLGLGNAEFPCLFDLLFWKGGRLLDYLGPGTTPCCYDVERAPKRLMT
jgi:hypothetical protein